MGIWERRDVLERGSCMGKGKRRGIRGTLGRGWNGPGWMGVRDTWWEGKREGVGAGKADWTERDVKSKGFALSLSHSQFLGQLLAQRECSLRNG